MLAAIGLPALGGVIVVLGLLASSAPLLPPRATGPATAGLCAAALLLALAVVLSGERAQALGGVLAVDGLSAFFALAPAFAGLAVACASLGGIVPRAVPALAAAGLLVVLAGDAATAVLAVALLSALAASPTDRRVAVAGVFLLAVAFAILAGGGAAFPAMRAAAPADGWRAGGVLAAAIPGVLCLWTVTRRHPASAALGTYLLARLLLDLCGPATPVWWAVPLLLGGGVLAVLAAVQATGAPAIDGVLVRLWLLHAGWIAVALGVAAVARAVDLPPLAAVAAGGAMLHALGLTVTASLAGLVSAAVSAGAGSLALDRLGGLARSMPATAAAMLVAGLGLMLLPPSLGFASGWMVLQALFATPRIGGLALQLLATATLLALAVSAGLGGLAVVRMAGLSCLGRPRSPRAAAAEEAGQAPRRTMLALAACLGLAGLFPGLPLLLAGPALRLLTGAGLDGIGGWAGLSVQPDSGGYSPLWLALLAGLGLAGLGLLVRAGRLRRPVAAPAWEGGFAAPPAWMPFGDPATQADALAFAAIVPAAPRWPAWPLPRLRLEGTGGFRLLASGHGLALLLAALVAMLGVVTVMTPG